MASTLGHGNRNVYGIVVQGRVQLTLKHRWYISKEERNLEIKLLRERAVRLGASEQSAFQNVMPVKKMIKDLPPTTQDAFKNGAERV